MFGFLKSPPFDDPQLGQLRRTRGAWRGTLRLDPHNIVPLIVCDSRSAPDPEALRLAKSVPAEYASWRSAIERELFEHLAPYAEAVTAGEAEPPESGLPQIDGPAGVWPHTTLEFVHVAPLDGLLTVELGYRVAWDEEHTLGARFRNGRLLELCGSVLQP